MFKYVPRGVSWSLERTSSKNPYLDSLLKLQQFFPLLPTISFLQTLLWSQGRSEKSPKNVIFTNKPVPCIPWATRAASVTFVLALCSSSPHGARIAQRNGRRDLVSSILSLLPLLAWTRKSTAWPSHAQGWVCRKLSKLALEMPVMLQRTVVWLVNWLVLMEWTSSGQAVSRASISWQ